MITEHLVSPNSLVELAKSPRNCSDFTREFTKPSPRVFGDYPKLKNLRRLTLQSQSADATELEQRRLDELLQFIASNTRAARHSVFDGQISFQANLKAIEAGDFSGIHLLENRENPHGLESDIIDISSFDEGIVSLPTQALMPKVVPHFKSTLSGLMKLSSQITIVEPYFDFRPGVWVTVIGLLEKCAESHTSNSKMIEILFSSSKNNNAKSCQYLADKLRTQRADLVASFSAVVLTDIEENGQEAVHNRYIISELAGATLGYGFEQTTEAENDEVSLLNETVYQKRFQQYVEKQSFNIVDSVTV